jgi:hypothetical protein
MDKLNQLKLSAKLLILTGVAFAGLVVSATTSLRDAVSGLKEEISLFTVAG